MGNLSTAHALIIDFVFLTISLLFLLLRLYVRLRHLHTFNLIDILIISSWLSFLGFVIVDIISSRMDFWDPRIRFDGDKPPDFEAVISDPTTLRRLLVLIYAAAPLFHICVYNIKISFCLLYLQLFPPGMKKLRAANWVTMVLVVGSLGGIILGSYLWCLPVERNWTLTPSNRCLSWSLPAPYIISTMLTIITDILVYALPFFLLPTLYRDLRSKSHTPSIRRRKITGIVVLFSLGILSLACTAGRITSAAFGPTAQLISAWNAAEMCSSIVVACSPPLKWFFGVKVRNNKRNEGLVCRCKKSKKSTNATSIARWDDETGVGDTVISVEENFAHGLAAPGMKGMSVKVDERRTTEMRRNDCSDANTGGKLHSVQNKKTTQTNDEENRGWRIWRNSKRLTSAPTLTGTTSSEFSRQESTNEHKCTCQESTTEAMGNITFGK